MEESRVFCRLMCSFHLYLCLAAAAAAPHFFIHCDASGSGEGSPPHSDEKLNGLMKIIFDTVKPLDDSPSSTNANSGVYGVSSPFTLPPYDSLAPIPLPQNAPPFCIYPQSPPSPASFSPAFPFPNPNPSPPQYNPTPIPPATVVPSPRAPEFSPPSSGGYVPSPPAPDFSPPSSGGYVPSPPAPDFSPPSSGGYVPSPPASGGGGGFGPSPPEFLPPIVYPTPSVPPPPYTAPTQALWCVAKPSVPGPIIQEALNYACASGAGCEEILPGGSCFEPNTLVAHASYAFNSYWQRTKVGGGTCGFGGIAILVTVDPSYDGCHFLYF